MKKYFTGELMTCVVCGAQQRSNPAIESQWRVLEIDKNRIYYACPKEFPPDGANSDDFKMAYQFIFSKILIEEAKAQGGKIEKLEQKFEVISQYWKDRLVQLRGGKHGRPIKY